MKTRNSNTASVDEEDYLRTNDKVLHEELQRNTLRFVMFPYKKLF